MPVSDLRYLSYESIGTKTNVGAVALFGVLGLGARRHWTLMTVGLPEHDVQVVVRAQLHEVRARLGLAIQENPNLADVVIEGPPPSTTDKLQRPAVSGESQLSELERLARLYSDGMLTDQEYSAMKSKLIADG